MSTFLEKEKQLIKAMHQQDFQPFFKGDKNDAFDTLAKTLDSFSAYKNSVIRMIVMQPTIYARYEGQDLRDKISNLDSNRRSAYESAIANISMLNRICDAYGTERFADINTKNRYQIANFVGQYCAEVYAMDALMEYPTNNRRRLTNLNATIEEINKNTLSNTDLSL